ncbi:histidine kinase [Nocardiopsis sp. EMB25]|uniref:sensor histidine kinase n=1 Tax=Nocardiopsis sp. EMB25 TaxID=2835867 RepID=UPI0022840C68|nr:histidine kinase [Nocardiopsis sp. EMB25]MCY9784407.1 histidine kinase [Nocardiopsis sp. EMB25]
MREQNTRVARGPAGWWRRGERWWWDHRLRFADWFYAIGSFPMVALVQIMPDIGLLRPVLTPLFMSGDTPLLVVLGVVFYLVPAGLVSVAVLFRRSRPHWLLALAFGLLLLFGNMLPAAFALYSYAVHFDDRRLLAGWFAVQALALYVALDVNLLAYVFNFGLFLVVPTTLGLWVGTRRQLIDRLQERAERLEREKHLMAEHAITAERTRIAREMHDVVAHRVSLMVLHAGGLEVSAEDPRTAEAAGLIRTTGREALAELRGILGVLRDEDGERAPTAPQPVLVDIDRLVGEWRDAGMVVDRGDTGGFDDLPPTVQRTAFRVVQEGLTNAAKHARGARVTLELRRKGDTLEVEVANGPATVAAPPPPSSGYGLAGIRERVALAGGSLTAGPRFDGGWRLSVVLPVSGGHEAEGE